jgi:hypothetical protein
MNIHPNEAFRQLLRATVEPRMSALKREITDMQAAGESDGLADKQADFRRLRDLEAGIAWPAGDASETAAVSALLAQWPADFAELPLWFSDPAAAAVIDPPGPALVIACSESEEARADREARERS